VASVIGIDQAARNTGICVMSSTGRIVGLHSIRPPKGLDGAKRLLYIRESLATICKDSAPIDFGVLEDYSYGSVNKKFTLGEVGGVIKITLLDAGISFLAAPPKLLKKFVTGRGNANKEDMLKAINQKYSLDLTDDNLADACGLADLAWTLFYKVKSPLRYKREVIKTISKST
jgi:Holliday junction resolvasome RuvABC endonuclease subunit